MRVSASISNAVSWVGGSILSGIVQPRVYQQAVVKKIIVFYFIDIMNGNFFTDQIIEKRQVELTAFAGGDATRPFLPQNPGCCGCGWREGELCRCKII